MDDAERPAVRASDADRQRVAELLRVAFDEGRLGLAEYDERVRTPTRPSPRPTWCR